MKMLFTGIILVLPICLLTLHTIASPVHDKKFKELDAKVLYDQRQEGEWNVRAHLDNFIIMIIPTQTVASSASPPSLLDFLTKSIKKGSHFKGRKHIKKQKPDSIHEETMHFIESKTAPYHVDLSKSKSDLKTDDALLTNSPSITVGQPENSNHKRPVRAAKSYVFTIPVEDKYILTSLVEPKSAIRKRKKTIKEKTKEELKLLGAEHEQCGPGMVRDSYGICKILKD